MCTGAVSLASPPWLEPRPSPSAQAKLRMGSQQVAERPKIVLGATPALGPVPMGSLRGNCGKRALGAPALRSMATPFKYRGANYHSCPVLASYLKFFRC
jgi:hypothetical protein